VQPDPELTLEDARSIRDAMWRMAQLAQDAAETLEARLEDEDLDGSAEALEQVQALSLEVSEEVDAYQDRHAR
jgi:hypothetical protein